MKIIFSNGTMAVISNCIRTNIKNSQGIEVEAIRVSVTDMVYDNFRSLFMDVANISEMSLLDNENAELCRLSGYVESMGVEIQSDPNTKKDIFTITLGKTTSIPDKVASLSENVKILDEKVTKITEWIESNQEKESTTGSLMTSLNESIVGFKNAVETSDTNSTNIQTSFQENMVKVNEIYGLLSAIDTSYKNIHTVLIDIQTAYTNLCNNMTETNRFSAEAVSLNDAAKRVAQEAVAEYQGMRENIDRMMSDLSEKTNTIDNACRVVTEMNTSMSKQMEEIKTVRENMKSTEEQLKLLSPVDISTLELHEAKQYRIVESVDELDDYLRTNPIYSSCHGGVLKPYTVTKEKQGYLQAMILTTQMSLADGMAYQPSWNATGEGCTYDWSLDELKQLAFEIEGYIRPLVSKQQQYEIAINACETMDELLSITFDYRVYEKEEPSSIAESSNEFNPELYKADITEPTVTK